MRRILFAALLALTASASAYAPLPPVKAAHKAEIDRLARGFTGKACAGEYMWYLERINPPYPASEIPDSEKEFLAQIQQVAEGWKGKPIRTSLEYHPGFVRAHHLSAYSNGYDRNQSYELQTYHLKKGMVVQKVSAACRLK